MQSIQIRLNNVRGSFLDIRNAYTPATGDAKYKGNFIGLPDSTIVFTIDEKEHTLPFTDLPKVIERLCKDEWNNASPPKLENYAFCKADGTVGTRKPVIDDEGEYYSGYDADTYYVIASLKQKVAPAGPVIVDQLKQILPAEMGHPVAGDIINVKIRLFAYLYEKQKGISAALEAIQMVKIGEPFGAKPADASGFDELEVDEETFAEDPNF